MAAFACWIAGHPLDARRAFAFELCAKLRRCLLAVKLIESEADWPKPGPDARSSTRCGRWLDAGFFRHGAVALAAEPAVPGSRIQEIRWRVEPSLTVGVGTGGAWPLDPTVSPDLCFHMGHDPLEASIGALIALLQRRGLLAAGAVMAECDEEILTRRLKDLGYL